ncbi:hypothetical protein HII36_29645 [Nonomuraea sp. NN258]|uniref:hypothetical protein n=1 Tax=Nonomuraea antri TaxID=2730852 RepID=UPI0015698E5D|nr:hypothetical protein [Nonomuraea antri]NRQ35965.1 hypothetical protein [Nonomuraea antri]
MTQPYGPPAQPSPQQTHSGYLPPTQVYAGPQPGPGYGPPSPPPPPRRTSPNRAVISLAVIATALVGFFGLAKALNWDDKEPETTAAAATEDAAEPAAKDDAAPQRTKAEAAFLAELTKHLEDGERLNENRRLEEGHAICGRGDEDAYEGPPTVDLVIEHQRDAVLYGAAVKHLCPKYLPVWKRAQGGFGEGTHTVGKDIKPGTYRTVSKPVTDCYWERSTGSGDIIANQLVNNAPNGITLTLRAGEGFTAREGCGNWIRVS